MMEVSGETYLYDRDGEWLISSMSTTTDAAGNQDTEVLLRQPMAGLRNAAAHLPHPELICESACEEHDDHLCVPRQLSELLRRPCARSATASTPPWMASSRARWG